MRFACLREAASAKAGHEGVAISPLILKISPRPSLPKRGNSSPDTSFVPVSGMGFSRPFLLKSRIAYGSEGRTLVQETFDDRNLEELHPFLFEDDFLFCCGRPFDILFFCLSVMHFESLFVKFSPYILKVLF